MRQNKSVGSKRKLEDTKFGEVSRGKVCFYAIIYIETDLWNAISGTTSHHHPRDRPNEKDMKASLSEAGFDIEGGKVGDSHLSKLYKKHVFESSKARKQSKDSTPYDEQERARIQSTRYSRTVYFDQDPAEETEIRVEKGIVLPPEAHLFSFSPTNGPKSPVASTSSASSHLIPELENGVLKNPSTGPVRARRISARLSALQAVLTIPEEGESIPTVYSDTKSRGNPRSHPQPRVQSRRTSEKVKKVKTVSRRAKDQLLKSELYSKELVIPECEEDDHNDIDKSVADAEEIRIEEQQSTDLQEVGKSKGKGAPPGSNRLPKRISAAPANRFGLRVSQRRRTRPASPVIHPEKKTRSNAFSDLGGSSDENEETSDDYLPSSDNESNEEGSIASTPIIKLSDAHPRPKANQKTLAQSRWKSMNCHTKSLNHLPPSSSDETTQTPQRTKRKVAPISLSPDSSEDTPDLHETSNFRESPIQTRQSSLQDSFLNSIEEGEPELTCGGVRKRWKGKGRAVNQEHKPEDEEDGENSTGSYNILQQTYSKENIDNVEEVEDEWEAGDLFGENFSASGRGAAKDFDDDANLDRQSQHDLPEINNSAGVEDFKEAIVLLKCLVTNHSKQIERMNKSHSKEMERMDKKIDVLTNMIDTYINKTPSTAPRGKRGVSNSSPESSDENVTPRAGRIRTLIKTLIRTLYGLKKNVKTVPDGSSPAEKQKWIQNISIEELLDKAEDLPDAIQPPIQSSGDPSFPYPDGPGGEKASSKALQIMWGVMQRLRVGSFRPDFSGPLASTSNIFLFRMAAVILIKLVQSGEYTGVHSEDLEPKKVLGLIVSHVKGTWFRNYREQREWSQERLQARDKSKLQNSRINRVREGRLAYVMSHKSLWPLSKVIQDCCSDDETDYEDEQGLKHCKVRILQWRSSALDSVFQSIDKARLRDNSIKLLSGNPHRVRSRSHNNPISRLGPPQEIHKDCISKDYYNSLEAWEKLDIKIINKSILTTVRDMISKNVLPAPL
ncbi:uncharacterized protein MELLADRAFT_106516 [Melampsora larici-populina 98AG31]|uniref:Uncharacterized protein n=1 Tax=Melampsora larici-populina (strain 98AG31 / pathotype 3-4-7) TaxID=747676 RepID=F4RLR7_MELLP|nr:uncharacterized protein MELLADRAFT_106516 [Melampsora larici-populina 98AG31]EGG06706.1 hypothetical protein MELLADRAFT_106516 [Melampsora larici-populina 98AG31]